MSCVRSSLFDLALTENSSRHYGFTRESRIFAFNEFYVKHSAQNLIFTYQEEHSGSLNVKVLAVQSDFKENSNRGCPCKGRNKLCDGEKEINVARIGYVFG